MASLWTSQSLYLRRRTQLHFGCMSASTPQAGFEHTIHITLSTLEQYTIRQKSLCAPTKFALTPLLANTGSHSKKIHHLLHIKIFKTDASCLNNSWMLIKRYSNPYTCLDRALDFHDVEAPKISRHSVHEDGKVVSPNHRPPLPPGDMPGTHLC